MQRLDERKHDLVPMFCIVICVTFITCLLLTQTVGASEIWHGTGEPGGDARPWDMTQFIKRILSLYGIFKAIAAPFAVASIAVSALEVIFGSEKEHGKALSRIKYTVIALACIYLIPAFIQMGYDAVRNLKWDPTNPDFVW